jgi:hypothetical protein
VLLQVLLQVRLQVRLLPPVPRSAQFHLQQVKLQVQSLARPPPRLLLEPRCQK